MSKLTMYLLAGLLLSLTTGSARAQHSVGIRAGYGGGSIRYQPARETSMWLGAPSAGASWRYYGHTPYVGGIGADLQYVRKGWKEYPRVDSDTVYQRTIDAIELPLIWQPHIYLFDHKMRAFLNLAVYVSYVIGSDYTFTDNKTPSNNHSGKYIMRSVRDNSWEYGLMGGAGFGVLFHKFELLVEARYSFGYSDILKSGTKYKGNPQRSPVDMINISLGFNYQLGNGEILSRQRNKKTKVKKSRRKNGNDSSTEDSSIIAERNQRYFY